MLLYTNTKKLTMCTYLRPIYTLKLLICLQLSYAICLQLGPILTRTLITTGFPNQCTYYEVGTNWQLFTPLSKRSLQSFDGMRIETFKLKHNEYRNHLTSIHASEICWRSQQERNWSECSGPLGHFKSTENNPPQLMQVPKQVKELG